MSPFRQWTPKMVVEHNQRVRGVSPIRQALAVVAKATNGIGRVSLSQPVHPGAVQGKFGAFGEIPLESWEQVQVVNWIKSRGHKVHHSPNGGKRGKAEAGRFKSEGVSAGFPDLICFSDNQSLSVIYIEMKRIKGGTVTPEQKEWNSFLNGLQFSHNIKAFICKGHQEAIQLLVEQGY